MHNIPLLGIAEQDKLIAGVCLCKQVLLLASGTHLSATALNFAADGCYAGHAHCKGGSLFKQVLFLVLENHLSAVV